MPFAARFGRLAEANALELGKHGAVTEPDGQGDCEERFLAWRANYRGDGWGRLPVLPVQ